MMQIMQSMILLRLEHLMELSLNFCAWHGRVSLSGAFVKQYSLTAFKSNQGLQHQVTISC